MSNAMTDGVSRDMTMDLQSLMQTSPIKEKTDTGQSPLDNAIAHPQVTGLIAKSDDIKFGDSPLRSILDSDERRNEFDDAVEEMEVSRNKAEAVVVIRKPENQLQMAQLLGEINAVQFDDEGNGIVPEGAKWIVSKKDIPENAVTNQLNDATKPAQQPANPASTKSPWDTKNYEVTNDDGTKMNIVQLLIDKTGLGGTPQFTEEEKEIIDRSDGLRIVEVEDKKLRTMRVERDIEDDLDFLKTVDVYDMSIVKTNLIFTLSGFKADMAGLNYGEFGDIALDVTPEGMEQLNFDKTKKMLYTLYTKTLNPSCGKFKGFDDYLKKLCWFDVPIAIYGVLISTQPEEDSLRIRCEVPNCMQYYEHKFSPRTLIDFSSASEDYLTLMEKISRASGDELFDYAENSLVRTVKAVELPSKVIALIGPLSAYDYLYTLLRILREAMKLATEIEENDGEPVNGVSMADLDKRMNNLMMLYVVRGFRIPKGDGRYVEIRNPEKVLEYIENYMQIHDYQIIRNIYEKAESDYAIRFRLQNLRCPHCGAEIPSLRVDVQELVFRIRQRMSSTEIITDNFHLF